MFTPSELGRFHSRDRVPASNCPKKVEMPNDPSSFASIRGLFFKIEFDATRIDQAVAALSHVRNDPELT